MLQPYGLKSVAEYTELCEKDSQFPLNPKATFSSYFTTWTDYLSIQDGLFYTFTECSKEIAQMMRSPQLKKMLRRLQLTNDYDKLLTIVSTQDIKIPSKEISIEIYSLNNLSELMPCHSNKIR
jgi:hypothetical protein